MTAQPEEKKYDPFFNFENKHNIPVVFEFLENSYAELLNKRWGNVYYQHKVKVGDQVFALQATRLMIDQFVKAGGAGMGAQFEVTRVEIDRVNEKGFPTKAKAFNTRCIKANNNYYCRYSYTRNKEECDEELKTGAYMVGATTKGEVAVVSPTPSSPSGGYIKSGLPGTPNGDRGMIAESIAIVLDAISHPGVEDRLAKTELGQFLLSDIMGLVQSTLIAKFQRGDRQPVSPEFSFEEVVEGITTTHETQEEDSQPEDEVDGGDLPF